MKIVLTGGMGHINRSLIPLLQGNNHEVHVISRQSNLSESLNELGAKLILGNLEDSDFLTAAFEGADLVYLMIPPIFSNEDWLAYQKRVADNFIHSIRVNTVGKVVMLSSIGAHLGNGAGPIDGLAYLEQQLQTLTTANSIALRPSYFFYNLYAQVPLIQSAGILGSNFGGNEEPLVLVHTEDIAKAAANHILHANFQGHTFEYVSGDVVAPSIIAAKIGVAIGKPSLNWVQFSDEQALNGMLQNGLPESMAKLYVEMGAAIRSGKLQSDFFKSDKHFKGSIQLNEFIKEFAQAFGQSASN